MNAAFASRSRWAALAALLLLAFAQPAAAADAQPPSLLVIVVDTLRADAVSAYGKVQGTTPQLDALAREGLLYENAWAPAPWTLPSHATIFTGTGFAEHRVGMPGQGVLSERFDTLAERLARAGYETAAFSENGLVVDEFKMLQGFAKKVATGIGTTGAVVEIDASAEILRWLEKRGDSDRPFFVFVNLMDPHQPYEVRPENPYVPAGTPQSEIQARSERPNRLSCGGLPPAHVLEVLHGLYLGDVQEADAKLGRIVRELRQRAGARGLVTLVTSDHGESFGERKLLGHEFTLHSVVLRVPLVLHGAPGATPGRVASTVGLVDVAPTLLRYAGLDASGTRGAPLPAAPVSAPGDRVLLAGFSDAPSWVPEKWVKMGGKPFERDATRQFCGPSDRVWGGMAAAIQFPFKYTWYERYPAELYDLSWDSVERFDVAGHHPERTRQFANELRAPISVSGVDGKPRATEPGEGLSESARKALEALGYVER